MFNKKSEDRLRAWVEFRNTLEVSENPIQDVIDLYNQAPLVSIQVDPYDKESWLDPWSLLEENNYCKFAIILGIYYTLQLTTRFSESSFEIHIYTDKENSEVIYLLYIDNYVVGWNRNFAVSRDSIPTSLVLEKKYKL